MPRMPTLGPQPKNSPLPKVIAFAVAVGAISGGVFYWRKGSEQQAQQLQAAQVAQAQAEAQAAAAAAAQAQAAPPSPQEVLQKAGLKAISVVINGPLETAVVEHAGSEIGPALTQVVTRTLVWWVQVPSEVLRGDRLDVLYEERKNEEPLVHAVRFESGKNGRTHEAYLFKSSLEQYPRYFEADGQELELRLKDTPVDTYEQITSLLRDGRRHQGVDFKTPVGTPVKATFDGVVTKRNWNFRGNGNSLEITASAGGERALYLHLDELPKDIKVGTRVRRGQVIAQSGNSGRSFAPHLHYQLMLASRVLDPFDRAPTWRRRLPSADQAAFDSELTRMRTLLSQVVAGK